MALTSDSAQRIDNLQQQLSLEKQRLEAFSNKVKKVDAVIPPHLKVS